MCNQNSCFGGSSCCWIIIAIILLFLFCGKRTYRIKGLLLEEDGFLLLYKRLDTGAFNWSRSKEEALAITPEQYAMLMQGLEIVARHPIEQTEDPKKLF